MKIIDASGMVLGRMATKAAKLTLQGEQVAVINCEKAVLSGDPKKVLEKFRERRKRGGPFHGPFYPKQPERIVRRAIRGMLPYHQERGRLAYKRVRCYFGAPGELEGETVEIQGASQDKLMKVKTVTLGRISDLIGAKQ